MIIYASSKKIMAMLMGGGIKPKDVRMLLTFVCREIDAMQSPWSSDHNCSSPDSLTDCKQTISRQPRF